MPATPAISTLQLRLPIYYIRLSRLSISLRSEQLGFVRHLDVTSQVNITRLKRSKVLKRVSDANGDGAPGEVYGDNVIWKRRDSQSSGKPPWYQERRMAIMSKPTSARQLNVEVRVQAKWCSACGKPTWGLGTITHKFGKLHYHVNLDGEGYCLKRHYNQLLQVTVNNPQRKEVTFSPLSLPMDEPKQLQPKLAEPPDQLQREPAEVPEG
ncbi:hypothetical protein ILUMI_13452 [Ignelater luminosus]|uniref:Uncharacterized protein n=1 Tax=Ignelater luminosus TaxID=2038154 RepID=A0A8K0GAX0_IGNLU|nr:hypothetical protein ILUMI_13452 [Ignelater luminosus]